MAPGSCAGILRTAFQISSLRTPSRSATGTSPSLPPSTTLPSFSSSCPSSTPCRACSSAHLPWYCHFSPPEPRSASRRKVRYTTQGEGMHSLAIAAVAAARTPVFSWYCVAAFAGSLRQFRVRSAAQACVLLRSMHSLQRACLTSAIYLHPRPQVMWPPPSRWRAS